MHNRLLYIALLLCGDYVNRLPARLGVSIYSPLISVENFTAIHLLRILTL